MNEGESAGGGHQGSNPAPPAVPDRRSTLPTTTQTTTATANSSSSNNNNNPNQTAPSIITIVTTTAATLGTSSATIVTTASPNVRSFQQVFSQQQQKQQQPATAQLSNVPTATTRQQSLSMPQQTYSPRYTATGLVTHSQTNQQQKQGSSTGGQSSYTTTQTPATSDVRTTSVSAPPGAGLAVGESPPLAKRQKIETTSESVVVGSLLPAAGSTPDSNTTAIASPQDLNALKKRILELKYLRLRSLKEKHSENVAELFYLHSGGNMMDYPTWRKKPPTPQFITFSNAYRLDQLVSEDRAAAAQQQQQQPTSAENIATIIGVSGGSIHQQQQQSDTLTVGTNKTNTQSQIQPTLSSSSSSAATRNLSSSSSTAIASTSGAGGGGLTSTTDASSGSSLLPQGAEIKIPAVGATPVAVSTKLPAAVVQLTQQGGTPLVPCTTGAAGSTSLRRNGGNGISPLTSAAGAASTGAASTQAQMLATPPPLYSPSHSGLLIPAATNGGSAGHIGAASSVGSSASSTAQEFSFKAKQEVYVMQRISELQREGLWTEKRLPKLQEPSRPKAHWDYLLEEMVWLAADFAQERKWKKNAAKKCAKMVQKYFQDKANAAQKAEKAQEANLKRIAAFISKEVKMFWGNVEKLVEYKHHTKLEEKRKKALDQHLSFIVDQTEKFSQQLAEGMNKSIMDASMSAAPSINSSRISSPKREATNISDDEFRPESASEDDEETIAKAEEEAADVKEEVAALEKESQMDLDDFINDLPKGYLENRDKIMLDEEKANVMETEDDTDDAEFEADEASEDDENTISKQEEEEMDVDHKRELDELEADNDLTVEQLMEKYKTDKKHETSAKIKIDSDDDDEQNADEAMIDSDDISTADETEDSEDEITADTASETDENEGEDGLKSLLEDTAAGGSSNNKDDIIKDAAALAESIQPKGNTLSSTNVVTPVPFLLKHTLREYQHIGLDWLVTMNERKLNGILADEMGLGKTIQTIALLAHLACVKGNWGPHLIVVPSSVMLNWEMEFKKWCPGFKILTYYGTQKERKLKRVGWTKPNAFHVCITSYKLVVQDQQSFRRKKWKYLILDEAQNIKNFKSQRWQLLLNFSTERRLLLTGTPLQNDLMELWSLMHFLMPYVFSSHREFKEWFSNPMTGMIEGNLEYNESLISRLHKVIRPFLLRRLKKEVEKQMPKKYEHVIMCRLSNRQRYLYDDFMSRSKTRETLQTGNLLSVINILMQLRKVCNHPNMFEVRPTISPFQMEGISFQTARLVYDCMQYDPFTQIELHSLNLLLMQLEVTLTAYVSHKSRLLAPPRKFIEEIDTIAQPPPRCPTGKYKFHIRVRDQQLQQNLSTHSANAVRVGASPAMKTEGNKLVPVCNLDPTKSRIGKRVNSLINPVQVPKTNIIALTRSQVGQQTIGSAPTTAKIAKLVQGGKPYYFLTSATTATSGVNSDVGSSTAGGRLTFVCKPTTNVISTAASVKKVDPKSDIAANPALVTALAQQVKNASNTTQKLQHLVSKESAKDDSSSELDPIYNMIDIMQLRKEKRLARLKLMAVINRRRSEAVPIYGEDCRASLEKCGVTPCQLWDYSSWQSRGFNNCRAAMLRRSDNWTLNKILKSYVERCQDLRQTFSNFVIYVPSVCAPRIRCYVQNLAGTRVQRERTVENTLVCELSPKLALLHPIISAMRTQFPDPRLIQYDCGKLQTLDRLLRQLKSGQHRVLIFTQMTKMLDVLEAFLNHHGHIYLRLDGSTRVEQRQVLMERFNGDKRIFVFILSTRSGGVGINLTGADTVIFYDSDWNPTMDAQAQDRCHRIGQTRDVHIYRLVSEKTIEVNILKKANQKRMLSDMAIEGGNFTTSFFKSSTIKDLFNMEQPEQDADTIATLNSRLEKPSTSSSAAIAAVIASNSNTSEPSNEVDSEKQSLRAFESALAAAEDEQDVQATKIAKAEAAADLAEFDETIPIDDALEAGTAAPAPEMSKADLEVQNLVKQLSPIERYAMRFVEATGAAWTAEQLRAAEEEIEAQKREWEANRLAALQKEEELLKQEAEADEMLTYNSKDASNQVNKNPALANRSKSSLKSKKSSLSRRQQQLQRRRLAANAKKGTNNANRNALKTKSNARLLNSRHKNIPVNTRSLPSSKLRDRKSSSVGVCSLSSGNSSNRNRNGLLQSKSGSNNKRTVIADKANSSTTTTAVVVEHTKPIRRTTRTSRAAAAAVEEDLNNSLGNTNKKEIIKSTNSPKKKQAALLHTTSETSLAKRATGIKNQKLLKIASKRMINNSGRRQGENRVIQPKKRRKLSATSSNRGRKSPVNCVRQLRNSPKKKEQTKMDEDEDEEVEEDENEIADEAEEEEQEEETEVEADENDENIVTEAESEASHDDEKYDSANSHLTEQNDDDDVDEDDEIEDELETIIDKVVEEKTYVISLNRAKSKGKTMKPTKVNNKKRDPLADSDASSDDDNNEEHYSDAESTEAAEKEQLNSNSMDMWNAHAQLQDTTTTNSTYYNVSEESDSEDNETLAQINSSLKKSNSSHGFSGRSPRSVTPANATAVTPQQQHQQSNHIDVNSPRTRSRGSVKINLWTLDVSPVLPAYRPQATKVSNKKDYATDSLQRRANSQTKEDSTNVSTSEANMKAIDKRTATDNGENENKGNDNAASTPFRASGGTIKTPLRRKGHKRLSSPVATATEAGIANDSKAGNSTGNTLHRWLLKTPRTPVRINDVTSAVGQSQDQNASTDSALTSKPHLVSANGPS